MTNILKQLRAKALTEASTLTDDPNFSLGLNEGILQGYEQVLTLLQAKYLDPKTDPTDPEAKALLTIARDLGKALRAELKSEARNRRAQS